MTGATGKRRSRSAKRTAAEAASFWPSLWASLRRIYLGAWRRVAQPRTLLHVALDGGLIIGFLLLFLLFNLLSAAIVSPLEPVVRAIQAVEAGGDPLAAPSIVAEHAPTLNAAITKMVVTGILFLALFLALYAFLKGLVWSSVRGERLTRTRYLADLAATGILILGPVLLSLLLLLHSAETASIALLVLLGIGILLLPLWYARISPATRPILWEWPAAFLLLILSALVLLPLFLFLELLVAGSFTWMPLLLAIVLGAILAILLWGFRRSPLHRGLLLLQGLLLLSAFTWFVAVNLLSLAVLIAPWLAFLLLTLWLILFVAWFRYALDNLRGEIRA